MAPFIFWNLAFYTIIRTQLREANELALYILIGNNKPEYGETKNASYYVVVYQKSFMFFINQRWFVKAPLC